MSDLFNNRSGLGFQGGSNPDSLAQHEREAALIKLLAEGVVACMKDVAPNDGELPDDDGVLLEDGLACSNFLFEQAEPTDLEQEEDP